MKGEDYASVYHLKKHTEQDKNTITEKNLLGV